MSKSVHKIIIGALGAIIIFTFTYLLYRGFSYYDTSLADRFYHPDDNLLKPSGLGGHGFGIAGSFFILVGVGTYMARKRYRSLSRIGTLKGWLEFHIFLCTLGPVLILYHTSFKFGGIVAVSFWSMVAVFLSGIIGRFIYIRIPRTIEGRSLSLNEVREMKSDLVSTIKNVYLIDEESFTKISESIKPKTEVWVRNPLARSFSRFFNDRRTLRSVRSVLRKNKLDREQYKTILSLVKAEVKLNRTIDQLDLMQKLFENWHIAHLPFAFVMLIIMLIHVGVTITFGYRWIF